MGAAKPYKPAFSRANGMPTDASTTCSPDSPPAAYRTAPTQSRDTLRDVRKDSAKPRADGWQYREDA